MPREIELDFEREPAPGAETRDIYTPSRLNREVRGLLERGFGSLWIEGEISNLSRPSSGHWYFSLKDSGAQLRCAMFRQRNLLAKFSPKDGSHVLARGRVSLYEPRGDYQFLVDYIEEGGEGALRRQFEQLKAKLAAEGLFAPERKRQLPAWPKRIGVVTSPTGAAIRDILNILRRRFVCVPVLIYPVPVQGAGAAEQIASMIRLASKRAECDVLIIARGGGSLEDLWSFNEEVVARAIFDCAIPIVSGVGHEIDFTIADFVADVRAPTPSGAAELVVPDCEELHRRFRMWDRRLVQALSRTLKQDRENFAWLKRRLGQLHPGIALRQRAQRLDELETRLQRALKQHVAHGRARLNEQSAHLRRLSPALKLSATRGRLHALELRVASLMHRRLEKTRTRFATVARTLDAVSPLATLDRGYSIVTNASGHVVTDASQLAPGDEIEARLSQGRVSAVVRATRNASDDK
jgi:exodeoxyribonuclease VII large subunit